MLEVHGEILVINMGNLDSRGNTLITLRADGEDTTHAFYIGPKQLEDLVFKLNTRTARAVIPSMQDRFWTKVG